MKTLSTLISLILSCALAYSVELEIDEVFEADFSDGETALILQFETVAGEIYQIETSETLVDFTPQGNAFIGLGGTMSKIAFSEGRNTAFFRVTNSADPSRLPTTLARKWVSVTAERAFNTVYTNDTPADINIHVRIRIFGGSDRVENFVLEAREDENSAWVEIAYDRIDTRFGGQAGGLNTVVPSGSQYRLVPNGDGTPDFLHWSELRIVETVVGNP